MKCFIKRFVLGLDASENSEEVCVVVNPIVRSLVTSTMFVVLVAVVANMLHV